MQNLLFACTPHCLFSSPLLREGWKPEGSRQNVVLARCEARQPGPDRGHARDLLILFMRDLLIHYFIYAAIGIIRLFCLCSLFNILNRGGGFLPYSIY